MKEQMPVIFAGHGSPMLALENSDVTRTLRAIGDQVTDHFGRPRAILAVSAHWYTDGLFVQRTEHPRQVYDMYGFPKELYEVRYPAQGDVALADRVSRLLGERVSVNNGWGIDHGAWTVLTHMFPKADIPVVQLSVDATAAPQALYEAGQSLYPLRAEGYLILGSGNVVHNLARVEWDNAGGSEPAERFNRLVVERIVSGQGESLIRYRALPDAAYAVPTPDHYLPLLYCLGAAGGQRAEVFNNGCVLGSIAMTGFVFGAAHTG